MARRKTDKNCVFCKVVAGDLPAYKIYEDRRVLAFLDIHPVTGGHALIIPKTHEEFLWDLENHVYKHLMLKARDIALRQRMVVKPKRIGVIVDGVDVPHAHVHLLPLKKPLKETLDIPEVEKKPNKKLMEKLTRKLKIQ